MKPGFLSLLIVFLFLIFLSCDKETGEVQVTAIPMGKDNYIAPCKTIIPVNACGITDIGNNLPWLKEIITKSIDDKTTNYWGRIWFKKYKNQEYIVIDMALGSGGLAFHTFTCTKDIAPVNDILFYNSLTERDIIWKSICWQ